MSKKLLEGAESASDDSQRWKIEKANWKGKGSLALYPIRKRTSSLGDQRETPPWRASMNTQTEEEIDSRCNH